jgi:hypothetical protein
VKLGIDEKERWKVYVFGALVVGGALYYFWPDSSASSSPTPKAAKTAVPAIPAPDAAPDSEPARRRANGRVAGDFRPKLRESNRDKRPDLTKIDPTIKLGLLARVQNVTLEGGARNIFQFGQAAPVTIAAGPIPHVPPIIPGKAPSTPPPPAAPPGPPPEPQAPPIPFKYYGYSAVKGDTRKRAFFLDGEDVIVAWEGDMIKNRYKVLHVGLKSVDMEDTQFKNGKQSLPLAEEAAT